MMTDVNPSMLLVVSRIFASFVNTNTGELRSISGTGFWYGRDEKSKVFITNKHNLDPRLKLGATTQFVLQAVSVDCREVEPVSGKRLSKTKNIEIDIDQTTTTTHPTADVAILSKVVWKAPIDGFEPSSMGGEFADQKFFETRLRLTDRVFFVGFPGTKNEQWWDTAWNLPISRDAVLASWPAKNFDNAMIKTSDTILVAGYSFAGSSGSPVFSHQKGIKINVANGISIDNPGFTPATLIGIMSGHVSMESDIPEMFRHTGLSYLTRSTAILECMQNI